MRKLFKHAPSPAMIVAIVAVVLALGGSAVAALGKKDKKQVRNIANGEITKRASGLAVKSADTAKNADAVGGIGPGGFQQGGGHTYFGAKDGAAPSSGNALLSIPGIANITFDCSASGVDSTVHITNTSGVNLGDVGQEQGNGTPGLNPFGPGLANGATVDLVHVNASNKGVTDTVLTLWNAPTGKVASIHISNVFCSYGASATTNQ
jgi:hypothetical protein